MSRALDYEDLDMEGLEPSMYLPIPRDVQDRVARCKAGEELRVLFNPAIGHATVVARSPGTATRWHGGLFLRGWAIVFHWDKPLGDGQGIADLIQDMVAVRDHRDAAAAEAEVNRRIAAHNAKRDAEEDQRSDDFIDSEFPSNSRQEDVMLREDEKETEKHADSRTGSHAFKRAKIVAPSLILPASYYEGRNTG